MSDSPVVTIVITTHDRPQLVPRAIASALGQTFEDVEVVVVDDGSTPPFVDDGSDVRVRVVRNRSAHGVTASRNLGLAVARGAWIVFLDDDDALAPTMLERCLAVAAASALPAPVAVNAAVALVDEAGRETRVLVPAAGLRRGEDYFLEGRGDAGRTANGLMIPVDVLRSIGGFDERYRTFEHHDLGLRLNRAASIEGLAEPLYRMTAHAAPRLSQRSAAIPAAMERTLTDHAAAFARHPRAHARFMGSLGYYALEAGDWAGAVGWSLRALRRAPGDHRLWFFFGAALAGPHALRLDRRMRPREATVSTWALTRSRVRKYERRLMNVPRAAAGAPIGRLTWEIARFRAPCASMPAARKVLVVSVYRARNASILSVLTDEAHARGWDVRLWALDEPAPALAADTVGIGADAKFPLLNAIIADCDLDVYDWVVVADDDFEFVGGSLGALIGVAEAADLDLVQPAHVERSHREHEFTVRRPLSLARRTTFVEIGPVFAVRHPWSRRVLPFPMAHTMGWGLELDWYAMERDGARLGIIDGVPLRHLHPVGVGYAKSEQLARLRRLMRDAGVESIADIQVTKGRWRPWRARPPWVSAR